MKTKCPLRKLPAFSALQRQLSLENNTGCRPGFRDSDKGRLLASLGAEFCSDGLNPIEGDLSGRGLSHDLREKSESTGDNVDQCFFRIFCIKAKMCTTKCQAHLVGENQQMTQFMPLGVVRAKSFVSAAVDDGDIGQFPRFSAEALKRDSQDIR